MNSFIKSEINTDFDLIAKELKRARLAKKFSLEEVSQKLKINIKYLAALEEGNFLLLPKGLYGKNFLKQYASFLGLSQNNILEVYEESNLEKKEPAKNLFSNQIVKNKYFLAIPSIIRNILIISVVSVLFLYLAFSFQKIRSKPELVIYFPPDDFVTEDKNVEISGSVESGAEISINGEGVLVDLDGKFFKKLNLKVGINEVIIEAKKKYGKINIIDKQILVNN